MFRPHVRRVAPCPRTFWRMLYRLNYSAAAAYLKLAPSCRSWTLRRTWPLAAHRSRQTPTPAWRVYTPGTRQRCSAASGWWSAGTSNSAAGRRFAPAGTRSCDSALSLWWGSEGRRTAMQKVLSDTFPVSCAIKHTRQPQKWSSNIFISSQWRLPAHGMNTLEALAIIFPARNFQRSTPTNDLRPYGVSK